MPPDFLSALMLLVSSFSQNGKPPVLPPVVHEEVTDRGNQVSDLVKGWNRSGGLRLDLEEPTGTPEEQKTEPTVTPGAEVEPPETVETTGTPSPTPSRWPAINLKSGIYMPAELPFNAIEHSRALDFFSGTPYPTPPGQNNGNGGNNGNGLGNSLRPDNRRPI